MPQFTLRCFGVGDGWPSAGRDHSSFLYQFGERAILIDCGEPVSRTYKSSGLPYDLIDRILVSHLHFDHVGGFFMLMQGFWLEGRKRELTVHAPAEGIDPMRQLLRVGCIFDELLPFPVRYEPLCVDEPIAGGGIRISPFPTRHLWSLRDMFQSRYPQAYEAFSFLIETEHFRIAHSADIGAVEDLTPLLEAPVDVLVCELAHVDPEELFTFLSGRRIGQIVFIHLGRGQVEDFGRITALARERLGSCPVHWPHGGYQFAFGSVAPGRPGAGVTLEATADG